MNWINFPRFKIEEEKQPKKKESNMKGSVITFIITLLMMFICFNLGYVVCEIDMEEQLHDKQIELNICMANMDLFKEDFDAFCAERFEKMGC